MALAIIATVLYALPTWLRSSAGEQLLVREGGDPAASRPGD